MLIGALIAILLLPITYFLGGFYNNWMWDILPTDMQVGTYLGNGALTTLELQSLITVGVAFGAYYLYVFHRKPKSNLLVLMITWLITTLILMHPLITTVTAVIMSSL